MGPRTPHRGLFALAAAAALPLLLPDKCALAVPWVLLKGRLGIDQCRLRGGEQSAQPGSSESSQSLRASKKARPQVIGARQTWG